MLQKHIRVDVCVLCALPEEADAVEEAVKRRYKVSFQQGFSKEDKYEYRFTTIQNKKRERLTFLLSWLPSKGLMETAVHFKSILQEFRPRFAAMTGICAGDKTKVRLGDLIVAECAYIYDSGKVLLDEEDRSRKKYLYEGKTYQPDNQALQYARRFRGWEQEASDIIRPLTDQGLPQCHIAPLASGNAVRSDTPFKELQLPFYKAAAIDMEGAAFYRLASDFSETRALLVKGVCDYADNDKNDLYHAYAALLSATYLICFIHEYVTEETMPGIVSGEYREDPSRVLPVPYLRNPLFTGREEILSLLQARLLNSPTLNSMRAQALCGLGGIGKTQIATEYIYRYADRYQQVFWANAATRNTLTADFVLIAGQLGLLTSAEKDRSLLINAVKCWLAEHNHWLLILDNANTLDLVYDFLPGRYSGHIILTTQSQALGSLAQSVELETLNTVDACILLLRRAKMLPVEGEFEHITPEDDAYARKIVASLGGFPLAIDQAGAYIEETGCSLADYLERFQQKEIALLQRRGKTSQEHPSSLVTTWSLSFEEIERSDSIAADVLRFCAFLAPDTIPQELFTTNGALPADSEIYPAGMTPSLLDEAIATLRHFSLISRHSREKTLSIHRLVQIVLKATMDFPLQCLWAERVVHAVSNTFPERGELAWSQCHRYIPHVHLCMTHLHDYALALPEASGLFYRVARWLHEHAQYKEAETFYFCACSLQEKQDTEVSPALAKTLDSLARLHLDQGLYQQATPFSQRALALKEELFGSEHIEVAITLHILGRLAHAQEAYLQAKVFYQRAFMCKKRLLGLNHPETATTLHALAWLYHDQRFYPQAELFYRRALSIRTQTLGLNHVSTAVTLHQLAWLYHEQNRYTDAEPLYKQALAIKEQTLDPKHPFTAITLHYFARFYHDQYLYSQAEELYQRALAIREQTLGEKHPFTATTLHHLARLYHDQHCYEQAEELYQRALTIREQMYGVDHAITASTLHHYARLYENLKEYAKADQFYRRTLKIREHSIGRAHPSTVVIAREYAHLLRTLHQESTAAELEEAYCIT